MYRLAQIFLLPERWLWHRFNFTLLKYNSPLYQILFEQMICRTVKCNQIWSIKVFIFLFFSPCLFRQFSYGVFKWQESLVGWRAMLYELPTIPGEQWAPKSVFLLALLSFEHLFFPKCTHYMVSSNSDVPHSKSLEMPAEVRISGQLKAVHYAV